MRLSATDHKTASEAAIMLKLTLEYHAHKITMVRYLTMNGRMQSLLFNVLSLSLLFA